MCLILDHAQHHTQSHVTEFHPDSNRVTLGDGSSVQYDYLVVATGMQAKWNKVKGLTESLGDGKVRLELAWVAAVAAAVAGPLLTTPSRCSNWPRQ